VRRKTDRGRSIKPCHHDLIVPRPYTHATQTQDGKTRKCQLGGCRNIFPCSCAFRAWWRRRRLVRIPIRISARPSSAKIPNNAVNAFKALSTSGPHRAPTAPVPGSRPGSDGHPSIQDIDLGVFREATPIGHVRSATQRRTTGAAKASPSVKTTSECSKKGLQRVIQVPPETGPRGTHTMDCRNQLCQAADAHPTDHGTAVTATQPRDRAQQFEAAP